MTIIPSRKIEGAVERVLVAKGADFVTAEVPALELTFGGIAGDFHEGMTRKSGGREPWYPRGLEMRNERQVSLVSREDCAAVATAIGLAALEPEWIGANIVVSNIAQFSMLPPRTLLFFEGGVTLKVDGQNAPCRLAARSIATHAGIEDVETLVGNFKTAAKRARGLVAWVEVPGKIEAGAKVTARLPEQWIYE
jgi:hypothetical protein